MQYKITFYNDGMSYFRQISYIWDKAEPEVLSTPCRYSARARDEWPERLYMARREAKIFANMIARGVKKEIEGMCMYEILEDE